MKPEPLKGKNKELTDKINDYLNLHRNDYAENPVKFILVFATFIMKEREKQEKSAVEWLKTYLKLRKEGHNSIKIDVLIKVIDEAFLDLVEKK